MGDLDLPPTLRVHPVTLNMIRIVDRADEIRLDVSDEGDGFGIQIVVYTAAGNPRSPKRVIRVDPAGAVTVVPT